MARCTDWTTSCREATPIDTHTVLRKLITVFHKADSVQLPYTYTVAEIKYITIACDPILCCSTQLDGLVTMDRRSITVPRNPH